jgi:hypothetical protein
MMKKFKFFDGITDNSYVFHAGFMQPIPVEQRRRPVQHEPQTEQTLLDILTSDTTIETDDEVIRGVETLTRNWNGGERA